MKEEVASRRLQGLEKGCRLGPGGSSPICFWDGKSGRLLDDNLPSILHFPTRFFSVTNSAPGDFRTREEAAQRTTCRGTRTGTEPTVHKGALESNERGLTCRSSHVFWPHVHFLICCPGRLLVVQLVVRSPHPQFHVFHSGHLNNKQAQRGCPP